MVRVIPIDEDYQEVTQSMIRHQAEFGDSITMDQKFQWRTMAEVQFVDEVPVKLNEIWKSWDFDKRNKFCRVYGKIGEFLGRAVDKNFLNAMMTFWDPAFHSFSFGINELCPTIEEIAKILEIPIKYRCFTHVSDVWEPLEYITGKKKWKMEKLVGLKGIPISYLVKLLEENVDTEFEFRIMALAIYGTVIFPKEVGFADRILFSFVRALEGANSIDPHSAILAEIISSLNQCRILGEGNFQASAHILYVWARSHFPGHNILPRAPRPNGTICFFYGSDWGGWMSLKQWIDRLMSNWGIVWRAPWMDHIENFLYRCGDWPWVPLLGVFNVTAYTPWAFRCQVREVPSAVPATAGLFECDFGYEKENMEEIKDLRESWKQPRRAKLALYDYDVSFMDLVNFMEWRRNRGSATCLPGSTKESEDENEENPIPDRMTMLEVAVIYTEGENSELKAKNRLLEAEVANLKYLLPDKTKRKDFPPEAKVKIQKLRRERDKAKRKLARGIEMLKNLDAMLQNAAEEFDSKDENARIVEELGEVNLNLRRKVIKLEKKIKELEADSRALKGSSMNEP